jgi:trypsin
MLKAAAFLVLALACVASLAQAGAAKGGGSGRIVNGEAANPEDYPWLVSLRRFEDGEGALCGGALIRPNVVLTAAHCIAMREDTMITIDGRNVTCVEEPAACAANLESAGANASPWSKLWYPSVAAGVDVPTPDTSDPVRAVQTKAAVIHERYNHSAPSKGYDIALLLLEEPVANGGSLIPMTPPGTVFREGDEFVVAGWGVTESGGPEPTGLLESTVSFFSDEDCAKLWERALKYGEEAPGTLRKQICALGTAMDPSTGSYNDTCQGDSGGPLIYYSDGVAEVAGIVSYGAGCVSQFVPWVNSYLTFWENTGQVERM